MDQQKIDVTLQGLSSHANVAADALGADILFFSGSLTYPTAYEFIHICRERKNKRKNVLLVVVTYGGVPHAAYKMARFLQGCYEQFWIFVPGFCSSAGTLLAVGAHKIYMGDFGELGPLDVQLSKKDEMWAMASALNVNAAVTALEETASGMFFNYLERIKSRSSSVTYRTAAEVSASLVSGLLSRIYSQIDPTEIGENSRAMDIAKNYATRLDAKSKNFKTDKTLGFLAESYPDHGFVIDREEAAEIFTNVDAPTDAMAAIEATLGTMATYPVDDDGTEAFTVRYLSDEVLPLAQSAAKLTVVDNAETGGVA